MAQSCVCQFAHVLKSVYCLCIFATFPVNIAKPLSTHLVPRQRPNTSTGPLPQAAHQQDSDAGGRRSRPRRRPKQRPYTRRKKHLQQSSPATATDAAGPSAAVGVRVLVKWKEEWAPAAGGWIPGTVVAVSDGSLPNPNGPGRVTRGWSVVRYDADSDCHVHFLDPEHHHDARGDREMAWRLQPSAQAAPERPRSPEEGLRRPWRTGTCRRRRRPGPPTLSRPMVRRVATGS